MMALNACCHRLWIGEFEKMVYFLGISEFLVRYWDDDDVWDGEMGSCAFLSELPIEYNI